MKKIVNPYKDLKGYYCFGCSPENPAGLKMEFWEDGDDIVCRWKPDPRFQGWLNTLHGGIQSALLDEICAWAVMRKLQTTGVTSKMEVRFLKPVSTEDSCITLRARITDVKRNLVNVEASLSDGEGVLCSKALCLYFTYPKEKACKEMFFSNCEVEENG